jgi:CheY-like chemotaxis protein/HPt (histidine-containing phosphotransfer) domain-containing protein
LKNTLSNIKVLIAEDNEVNKLLVKRMLEHWGMSYETASNGFEVLELIKANIFNIVLMDIQMPNKNGIDAAREIRNLADETKKNIPIIALTANALKGEEKKYEEVGMNDFLTKPFKEKELLAVLERVFNNNNTFGSRFTMHTLNPENIHSSEKLYNLSLVNDLAEGNTDFIKSLVQIFIDTIPATSKEMLVCIENAEWEQAGKLAHKLKSTIDTMQFVSIKEDIRFIELNGKNKTNTHQIRTIASKVDAVIITATTQLKAEFGL